MTNAAQILANDSAAYDPRDPFRLAPTLAMSTVSNPATAAATPGDPAPASSGRLRSGELRRLVAQVLADHAGAEFTPREVAAKLGRSSGAIANALVTLADRGEAERTSHSPVRYRATTPPGSATTSTAPATDPTTTPTPSASKESGTAGRSSRPSAATTAPQVEEKVTGPVTRPNGQTYHPRSLSGTSDVTALRKLRAAGIPALLYGPPGTGKTSVIEAAFPDLVTVQGDGDTTVADFVGEYTQTPDGRYVFVHGPLITAMREGRCLFIDDATLIPPTVLAVVYPAMDGRRQIIIKANSGEVVTAEPGFYVVAGHNPGVHGAVLTDALSSRFAAQIEVSTDFDLARELKINARAIRVARHLTKRQQQGEIGWAPQLRELIAFDRIEKVLGTEAAAGNLIGIAPEEDRETVAAVVRNAFGIPVEPLALGGRI